MDNTEKERETRNGDPISSIKMDNTEQPSHALCDVHKDQNFYELPIQQSVHPNITLTISIPWPFSFNVKRTKVFLLFYYLKDEILITITMHEFKEAQL